MKNLHDLSKPHFLSELGGPLYMVLYNTAICLYVSLQFCKLKCFFGLTVSLDACIYACLYLVLYFILYCVHPALICLYTVAMVASFVGMQSFL